MLSRFIAELSLDKLERLVRRKDLALLFVRSRSQPDFPALRQHEKENNDIVQLSGTQTRISVSLFKQSVQPDM